MTKEKTEIIKRAKKAKACTDQLRRAEEATTPEVLLEVLADNIVFACDKKIIDADLLLGFDDTLLINKGFYVNKDIGEINTDKSVYLFNSRVKKISVKGKNVKNIICADNSTIESVSSYGTSTIERVASYGNSTIEY